MNPNLQALRYSGIRAYSELAKSTPGCIDLTIGEPELDTPVPIREAAKAALDAGRTHYAPNRGTASLRRAIAAYESARGLRCNEEQVLVTMGATGALYAALTGILAPGDEVIILKPAFSLYESIALAAGARPVYLDLSSTGFQLTLSQLEAVYTPRTRAIVVNSPCNPTGTVLSASSLAAIAAFAREHDLYAVCDNVYMGLTDPGAADLSLEKDLKLLYCQSLSKSHAMTGWRIGYLVAPQALVERLVLLQAAELACLPTFVQDAAETALVTDVTAIREEFARRRQYVYTRLKTMGMTLPEPKGGFYAFPSIEPFGMADSAFCRMLIEKAGVAAVPGEAFGTPGYIRISACRPMEELKTAMDRLEGFLKIE